jgi:hypothetical protein
VTPISIAALSAGVFGYLLLRVYAVHRVAAGHSRWLWVRQSLPIMTGLFLVIVAIGQFDRSPVVALFIGAFGVFMAAIAAAFVRRSIRAMATATTPQQRADALLEPTADYSLAWMSVLLLFALAMGFGLVVLAVAGKL